MCEGGCEVFCQSVGVVYLCSRGRYTIFSILVFLQRDNPYGDSFSSRYNGKRDIA